MWGYPLLQRIRIVLFGLSGLMLATGLAWPSSSEAKPRDKERWDDKYQTEKYIFGREPIPFLVEHVGMLPKGKALDLAMGEGRNGVFLATKGFQVTGLDISEMGLKKANALAQQKGVSIETQVVDLENHTLPENTYDVVICTYYLQRDLFSEIKTSLKPGGMALVETYTLEHQQYRPRFRKEYLLKSNELLELFKGMTVLRYQFVDDGKAAYASIIVQKP